MRHQQRLLTCITIYLLLCFAAFTLVRGEEATASNDAVPQASTHAVSDWALAGVVWSDASLTQKLAIEAKKNTSDPERVERLSEIAGQADQVIRSMEQFGWRQVRKPVSAKQASATAGKTGETSLSAEGASLKRLDTQTPAGVNDPGIDDELTTNEPTRLDIEQYRVDDRIDERPREERNAVDAVEDGVEGAIAAAAGRKGLNGAVAGYISERETQTRSATLPYAEDSIYDADDYDPDIDYQDTDVLERYGINPEVEDSGDEDDEVNVARPAEAIDGEDELTAELARNASDAQRASRKTRRSQSSAKRGRASSTMSGTQINRFTSVEGKGQADARWVQLHVDVNQLMWNSVKDSASLDEAIDASVWKLQANARIAATSTQNEKLRRMLERQVLAR